MPLTTRLTEYFGIDHPILLAPMALAAGGRLAAAVTEAGGLGLIGGAYGDLPWLDAEIAEAAGARVGYGFITWRLAQRPEALDLALAQQPAAIMLSFGDLRPFAERIRGAGVPLIGQVQTVAQARQNLEVGVDVLVAQGSEAGGHGMSARSTFTLLPEVADLVAELSPQTLVVAAGGVADGRGLAAALTLGADGVLVGTRLWASREALVSPRAHQRALIASGDDTYRTGVYDIVRQLDWPVGYNARALRNSFGDTWRGRESELLGALTETLADYQRAVVAEDFDTAGILVGEAVGQIDEICSAADIVNGMAVDAVGILLRASAFGVSGLDG
ncbi:NAD(P)H-dependent flavin oxidoreductase [Mycolicibacter arupensis]|jgi:nitronate monooxygenase|uniref:Nitronate monooxygenase n=1 Tax=Mycolicibacter arupensis TaxID=342002 RepID=A0A0F5MY47_9MYCO|nr:nitronate monooxygenase [Mycolicibacter arupensis]KAA1430615.1 nitronate monooxygenase [Mycolicibacter arupensis]KKB99713.1 oxidoreductase [Mycolicibacter arupensis]MCV7275990.1 nitronate monooxygenase [Mycolicibacter arupensis]OQZ95984.1 oxidoreductase [Mycolicibacter arupensis]TXI50727.1 MAG: nitronate monooxygenase [Mycolicibacter arupensis]